MPLQRSVSRDDARATTRFVAIGTVFVVFVDDQRPIRKQSDVVAFRCTVEDGVLIIRNESEYPSRSAWIPATRVSSHFLYPGRGHGG